jgi:hypothetical protein
MHLINNRQKRQLDHFNSLEVGVSLSPEVWGDFDDNYIKEIMKLVN